MDCCPQHFHYDDYFTVKKVYFYIFISHADKISGIC